MNNTSLDKAINGKSIASFVLGILTIIGLFFFEEGTLLSVVGIILGVIGLKETKQYKQKGRILALLGVVFNLIGLVGSFFFIIT